MSALCFQSRAKIEFLIGETFGIPGVEHADLKVTGEMGLAIHFVRRFSISQIKYVL